MRLEKLWAILPPRSPNTIYEPGYE